MVLDWRGDITARLEAIAKLKAPTDMTNEELAAALEDDISGSIARAESEFACDKVDYAHFERERKILDEAVRRLRENKSPGG